MIAMSLVNENLVELLASPDWLQALTLAERAALGKGAARAALPTTGDVEARERANRRLARWQAQEPFSQNGFFGRRLAADGVTIEVLRDLLAATPVDLAAAAGGGPLGSLPGMEWLGELEAAFGEPAVQVPDPHLYPANGRTIGVPMLFAGVEEVTDRYAWYLGHPVGRAVGDA